MILEDLNTLNEKTKTLRMIAVKIAKSEIENKDSSALFNEFENLLKELLFDPRKTVAENNSVLHKYEHRILKALVTNNIQKFEGLFNLTSLLR